MTKKRVKIVGLCVCILFTLCIGITGIVLPEYQTQEIAIETGLTTSQVRTVQTKLKNWGYYTGSVDGIYGAKLKPNLYRNVSSNKNSQHKGGTQDLCTIRKQTIQR